MIGVKEQPEAGMEGMVEVELLMAKKVLIEFDSGFLARIERERVIAERAVGKRPARTVMIRELLTDAMNGRCLARGEDVPVAVAVVETVPEAVSEASAG